MSRNCDNRSNSLLRPTLFQNLALYSPFSIIGFLSLAGITSSDRIVNSISSPSSHHGGSPCAATRVRVPAHPMTELGRSYEGLSTGFPKYRDIFRDRVSGWRRVLNVVRHLGGTGILPVIHGQARCLSHPSLQGNSDRERSPHTAGIRYRIYAIAYLVDSTPALYEPILNVPHMRFQPLAEALRLHHLKV